MPGVKIYTDGACDPNPGPGGWAVLLRFGNHKKILSGFEPNSTNNRMELKAAIEALKALRTPSEVDLFTDSEYLKRGISEWLPKWKQNNWHRKSGKLANLDLWKQLDELKLTHKVNWHWIRGHDGNPDNELVDRLAKRAL